MNLFVLLCREIFFEWSTFAFQILTVAGIIIALFSWRESRRSGHFSTMVKCTEDFRKIVRKMQKKEEKPEILKKDFLGLFNEQLFFIQNRYVPEDIAIEWLSTMYKILFGKDRNILLRFDLDDMRSFERVNDFYNYCKGVQIDENKSDKLKKIYKKHYK